MPTDGPGLGWTVNVTWAWRGTDTSDLLCDVPNYTTDYWGNPFNGTILMARRGNCAFGIKAANAMLLGAVGLIVIPTDSSSPGPMVGSQNIPIPVHPTDA
jgi:hypothetical protein